MEQLASEKLSQLPQEMLTFTTLKSSPGLAPRLGRLCLPGRVPIETPHYTATTSRGVVPHLSQDMFRKYTDIHSVYLALEDFIEKSPQQTPPILRIEASNGESPLRRFVALPENNLLVLGVRRTTPVTCPMANTNGDISICTSVGFRQIGINDYIATAQRLRPDILIGPGDIPFNTPPGLKRMDKMSDRTAMWMRAAVDGVNGLDEAESVSHYNLFAPILPISIELQSWYLNQLVDEMFDKLAGLAIYDAQSIAGLPDQLSRLPRLTFTEPSTPQRILSEISLGSDLITVPFISIATDAGVGLDFTFPAPETQESETLLSDSEKKSLGVDFWSPDHALDLSPLGTGCGCYACSHHHRAYLQHLLVAKEMLGWVLIQVHNHAVMDRFFAGIRASIERGTFEQDKAAFERYYKSYLPEKTGEGPRVRGYQYKSEGPREPKKNAPAFRMLNDMQDGLKEAPPIDQDKDAGDLEKIGFAETTK